MAIVSLEIKIVVISFVAIQFNSSQLLTENTPDLFRRSEKNLLGLLFFLAVLPACKKKHYVQISVNQSWEQMDFPPREPLP